MDELTEIHDAADEVLEAYRGNAVTDVRSIETELYIDSTGDEAVRFIVVLADRPGGELHRAEDLRKIDAALAEALLVKQIERVPYTEFVTESELRDSSSGAGGDSQGAAIEGQR